MSERELLALAERRFLGNYRPAPVVMQRGRGVELFDTEGRRYLDFCAGVAVCCLGHAHPELAAALADQAQKLIQPSNYYYNEENVRLADELCAATGYDRAFFCNSGAEANEALLKLARRHFHERGAPRARILAFEGSFHGRTMGALSLTGNPSHRLGFAPLVEGIEHLPYGDLPAVAARLDDSVAAVLVEPVLGEGGVVLAPHGFLAGLREACDRSGALLLFDEVQTGIGRTGKLLAAEHVGVRADATALAKGLGGGVPIGAILLCDALAAALPPGAHGSTFGGNALASRAARTVLRIVARDGLCEAATRMGERLDAGLQRVAAKHAALCQGTRGLGLLRALVLAPGAAPRDVLPKARARGLLLTAAGASSLRFTPPLIVSAAEIDEAVALIDAALADLSPADLGKP